MSTRQTLGIARAAVSQSRVKNQSPLRKHKLRDRRPTEKALCRIMSPAGSHRTIRGIAG